jgi:hypothetical protein
LSACSADNNEGWYAYDYFDQIHQIVRRKWQGLLAGLKVSDEDCEDLLETPRSRESRRAAGSGAGTKGKGASKGKGRGRSKSAGGGGSESDDSYGSTGDGVEGEGADGSGSENGGSGSGGSDSGASSSGKGRKARKKSGAGRNKRAPWEAPRQKRNRAKQPESESAAVRFSLSFFSSSLVLFLSIFSPFAVFHIFVSWLILSSTTARSSRTSSPHRSRQYLDGFDAFARERRGGSVGAMRRRLCRTVRSPLLL